MNKVTIFPMNSTYIDSYYPNRNFFKLDKLEIDNYCNHKRYTLLNFPLSVCDRTHCMKWYLYLPLSNINYCYDNNLISVSIVYGAIKYNSITYNTIDNFTIYNFCYFTIDKKDIYRNYVLIEISPLVYNCIEKGQSFINIIIGAKNDYFNLSFDKNNLSEIPKLIVNDSSCNNPYDNRNCYYICDNKQVAMELNLSNQPERRIIYNEDVVKFSNIVTKTPSGLEYDFDTYNIRVTKKGYYIFQWNLSIEGTNFMDNKNIALRNNDTKAIYEYPVPKSIQGQISGMALVDVNEDNQSFSLVNLSGGDILLSDLNPCASIIIIRV